MKLFLLSAYDTHPCLDALRAMAERSGSARHTLADSAEAADAILFVENVHFDDLRWTRLRRHPLLRRFPRKCFLYNEADKPWDVMRGLYCSLTPALLDERRHVPFVFLGFRNPHLAEVANYRSERRWLYSFIGAMSHPCRRPLLALDDEAGFVRDTSEFNVWHASAEERARNARQFADTLADSLFALCPRGIGPGSLRLFEAMEAKRAPVIIGDDWLPPPHVDWSFALRVAERDVHTLPALLRAHADEAHERGEAARSAWAAAYAPDTLFATVGDSLEHLCAIGHAESRRGALPAARQWLVSGEYALRDTARALRRGVHASSAHLFGRREPEGASRSPRVRERLARGDPAAVRGGEADGARRRPVRDRAVGDGAVRPAIDGSPGSHGIDN